MMVRTVNAGAERARRERSNLRMPMQADNLLSFVILYYLFNNPTRAQHSDLIDDIDELLSLLGDVIQDMTSLDPENRRVHNERRDLQDTYNLLQSLRTRYYRQERRPEGRLIRGLRIRGQ